MPIFKIEKLTSQLRIKKIEDIIENNITVGLSSIDFLKELIKQDKLNKGVSTIPDECTGVG